MQFNHDAQARPLKEVKDSGTLRIGIEPGFLPFEMKLPTGEWVGFDIDMMEAFAAKLGVKTQFIDTKWDGIIPALMANKFDLIVSGMTITEERKKAVVFSDPYYDAGLLALIQRSKADKLKTFADLDHPGHKVTVKQGTTGDIFAQKTLKKAKIIKLESEADAATSVQLGKADAFIYDKPFLKLYSSLNPERTMVLDDLLSKEQFGVAARPKDADLIAAFNVFLAEWRSSGGYDAAIKKNFETMPWQAKIKKLW
jgi:polar amino acid transport system substrate-binding protein